MFRAASDIIVATSSCSQISAITLVSTILHANESINLIAQLSMSTAEANKQELKLIEDS